MKKNIFLYLFVFVSLILLYSLINGNKIQNANELDITKLQNEVTLLKDSVGYAVLFLGKQ